MIACGVAEPRARVPAFTVQNVSVRGRGNVTPRRHDGFERRHRAAGSTGLNNHARNIDPMLASRRCGAKTRDGGSCRAPALRGKQRCRKHGGAPGSGAPKGNRNARRHGVFTAEAIVERKRIGALLSEARKFLREMK